MANRILAFDRGGPFPHQGRSVTIARQGVVATSHPLASQAGLDILKAGGNAADAAIAANAMLGVVEPMSCGIGGDLFVIYWDAKTQKLYGLNGSGRSPYTLTREVFAKQGLKQIPSTGPLSWSVPGCVHGWLTLYQRFGKRPFHEILAAAIDTAEEGFPVSEIIAGHWKSAEANLKKWPDSAKTLLIGGERAPREGEVFRNPNLAESYRLIVIGPDEFYGGQIARAIAKASKEHGGYLTEKDLADHKSDWIEPVSTSYRGYDVWELPPNGQGIAALEMLNILEQHNVKALGHNSVDYLHLFLEAKKLAFADRAKFYADPAFAELPVKELISKEYAKRQNARIDPKKAATEIPPGDPKLSRGDTIYLSVVDKDRNCCSLIQSNYSGFGSDVVPGDIGFVDPEPRLPVRARRHASQSLRAAQASLPHDHSGHGHKNRGPEDSPSLLLRRDGGRHAAARARAGTREPARFRHERASRRRRGPRVPHRHAPRRRARPAKARARCSWKPASATTWWRNFAPAATP